MSSKTMLAPIYQTFRDPSYAWELLETQISLQLSMVAQSHDIAKLLAMYMAGVEKMNSVSDPRQTYFKNKAIALMGKANVIRSLNTQQHKSKLNSQSQFSRSKNIRTRNKQKQTQDAIQFQIQGSNQSKLHVSPLNFNLMEKKKEMEVRLAYVAQEHSPEALGKILKQHTAKQAQISEKIDKIMDSHEAKLNERLQKRLRKRENFKNSDTVEPFKIEPRQVEQKSQLLFECSLKAHKLDNENTRISQNLANEDESPIHTLRQVKSMKNLRPRHRIWDDNTDTKNRVRKMTYDWNKIKEGANLFEFQ